MDRFYPRFMILFSAICLLLICLCGCSPSVWVHYPNRLSRAKLFLTEGRDSLAEKELNNRLKAAQDRLLYSLEMGMVHYLKQDFDQSIQEWLVAEEIVKKFDFRPVVSIREVSEQIGTLAVNDYLMTYQGMTYERVLLHLYLTLAFMMKSDSEGARIELKNAEQVQKKGFEKWQERRSTQLKDTPDAEKLEKELIDVYHSRYGMDESYTSFSLNPLVYYLSGWLYEEAGYPDEALIDYRRLWGLGIKTNTIAQSIEQLNKKMASSWSAGGKSSEREYGHLLILHHQGLVPPLEEIRIPVQIKGSLVIMALPAYPEYPPSVMGLRIRTGEWSVETQELVDVYSLAKESLRERIPGIVAREVARMIVKANAAREMSKQKGSLASMVATIYNIVSEKADLRSWLTLPLSIQVGQMRLPPGRNIINMDLINGAGNLQTEIEIKPGKYHILDVRSIGSRIVSHFY